MSLKGTINHNTWQRNDSERSSSMIVQYDMFRLTIRKRHNLQKIKKYFIKIQKVKWMKVHGKLAKIEFHTSSTPKNNEFDSQVSSTNS